MFAAHQKATSQEERAWVEAETIGQVQANDREGSCSAEGAQCEGRAGAAGANAPGPGEDTAVSWQVEAELDCMPKRQWCMLAPIGTRMPRVLRAACVYQGRAFDDQGAVQGLHCHTVLFGNGGLA